MTHGPLCVLQSVETVCALYHSFQDASVGLMEGQKETAGPDTALLRPCPRHMSVTERLRKVVQELVDTEKSYVKVRHARFGSKITNTQGVKQRTELWYVERVRAGHFRSLKC